MTGPVHSTISERERAILVGVQPAQPNGLFRTDDSIEELSQLAAAAGAEVLETVVQRRGQPSPAHYIGKGKLRELCSLREQTDANLVLFDDELSPTQQRNLENALRVKVLDRTALILDIFGRRARTREGRLQVDLAQHEYLLPRLAGQWSHLERLGGGIGTRGPGETQLETDRRLIRGRIERLKQQLGAVRRHRQLYRRRRSGRGVPVVALVGYTNAGKSTLMNALSNAQVAVEGRLFATLDPTTRRIKLPSQREVLLTDTVGFIQKLPTQLVASFRATLEELHEAALLLHVVDISYTTAAEQAETVDHVLGELGLTEKPTVLVANKVDLLVGDGAQPDLLTDLDRGTQSAGDRFLRGLSHPFQVHPPHDGHEAGSEAVLVSAVKSWGLGRLLDKITEKLGEDMVELAVEVPYNVPNVMMLVRRYGQVLREDYRDKGIYVRARVPAHLGRRLEQYTLTRRGRRG